MYIYTPKKVAKNNDCAASVHCSCSRARARAYPGRSCDRLVQSASQETRYLSCSFARKDSQKNARRIESPPSVKHPQTTSTLESCSFIFSWPPHVSLLPDLIFLLRCYKAPPGASATAGYVSRLVSVVFNASSAAI